jgi:DMSO/TMAO reductase YedYZ molybdopterin-dependent catalytic subunit
MKRMPEKTQPLRRSFLRVGLATMGAALLGACDRITRNDTVVDVIKGVQHLNRATHKLITGRRAMAQEFTEADISPSFHANGTTDPNSTRYRELVAKQFGEWSLQVGGLVERPMQFSLTDLRALPPRTQITRHDCVEGWSAIGKWTGVPLQQILALVKPLPGAQYVVFRCFDPMGKKDEDDISGAPGARDSTYYESIDMDEAMHAQTILAYDLNGKALPIENGAPLRLRVERQLGYKQAKYLMKIELVSSFEQLRGGKGGYWEDLGYEWYAGI